MPFDFFVPSKNLLIEYDGEQHYIKNSFGHCDEELDRIKERDKIKTLFCEKNKIKLLRISYMEAEKIEEILYENFR